MRTRFRFIFDLVLSLALLGVLVLSGSISVRAAVSGVTLANPAAGTYGEDDDYFTTVWGNPRDMDDPHDLYVLNSTCGPPARSMWTGTSFSGGIWSATTAVSGEWRELHILNSGWLSTLDIGEDGQLKKIDTSRYKQLTFRMWVESGAGSGPVQVIWRDAAIGVSDKGFKNFNVQADSQWHIYTLDLTQGIGGTWSPGNVSALLFRMNNLVAGNVVKIDWIRLTPKQTRQVSWSGGAPVDIFLGPSFSNPELYSHLLVYESSNVPQTFSSSPATIPASFPGGTYYARVSDTGSVGGGTTSSGAWQIQPMPIARIVAPSYTSGQDWATAVAGDPWDMDDAGDLDGGSTQNLSFAVSGGVANITNPDDGLGDCDGAWPHRPLGLNLHGQTIDSDTFKYLTYRYKVDQAPDQGAGGVMRVRWMETNLWAAGRTDDVSLYNSGWNTYKLDLSTVPLEAELAGWMNLDYNVFQLIAHESHNAWTAHLDWVKLTKENQTSGAYLAGWNIVQGSVVTTTAYWDTNRDPSSGLFGATIVPTETTFPPPPGPEFVYLPLVMRNYGSGSSEVDAERSYAMSSAGMSNGQYYYFVLKVEDGYNTVYWVSELPVKKVP